MSRMLNPSPGEVADRQTILQLKIQHGTSHTSTPTVQHFAQEHDHLQEYLEDKWFPQLATELRASYDQLYSRLATINKNLWECEDQARALRDAANNRQSVHQAGELLFEITHLNDDRAEVVKEINELFGINVQEKIYP
jgi:hypothetical protein